jgi:hypothetical protein
MTAAGTRIIEAAKQAVEIARAGSPLVTLTGLVDRAAGSLASARTAAEVLDARDQASFAYDTAKKTARLMKAKQAHDDLIAAAYRAQADALEIEAQAKRRLADEYDAAQERGEVQLRGGDGTSKAEVPTANDIGLSHKEIHEARIIRDAEEAHPGIVRQTVNEAIVKGEEPTKAEVRRAALRVVKGDGAPAPHRRRQHRDEPVLRESQHDRDLSMILGVWGAACATAQSAFLETVCSEFQLKPEH